MVLMAAQRGDFFTLSWANTDPKEVPKISRVQNMKDKILVTGTFVLFYKGCPKDSFRYLCHEPLNSAIAHLSWRRPWHTTSQMIGFSSRMSLIRCDSSMLIEDRNLSIISIERNSLSWSAHLRHRIEQLLISRWALPKLFLHLLCLAIP